MVIRIRSRSVFDGILGSDSGTEKKHYKCKKNQSLFF